VNGSDAAPEQCGRKETESIFTVKAASKKKKDNISRKGRRGEKKELLE